MARHLSIEVRARPTVLFRLFTSGFWVAVLYRIPARVRPSILIGIRSRMRGNVMRTRITARPTFRVSAPEGCSIMSVGGLGRLHGIRDYLHGESQD